MNIKNEDEYLLNVWDIIVPDSLARYTIDNSSDEIRNTILSARIHYYKALKLKGIDNEMAAIRFIASIEEMIVAVLKLASTNGAVNSSNIKFLRKMKNHYVKQAMLPVLSVFHIIIEIFFDGKIYCKDDSQSLKYEISIVNNKINLVMYDSDGNVVTDEKILSNIYLTSDVSEDPKEIPSQIFESMENICRVLNHKSVKEYLEKTVQFRNKLLYSDGKEMPKMGQSFDELRAQIDESIFTLNWMVGILLDPEFSIKLSNLINQFIDVYKITLEKIVSFQ